MLHFLKIFLTKISAIKRVVKFWSPNHRELFFFILWGGGGGVAGGNHEKCSVQKKKVNSILCMFMVRLMMAPLIEIGDNTIVMKNAGIYAVGYEQLFQHEAPLKIGKDCILHCRSLMNPGEVLQNNTILWPHRRPDTRNYTI